MRYLSLSNNTNIIKNNEEIGAKAAENSLNKFESIISSSKKSSSKEN